MEKQCYGCFENHADNLDMCPRCGYEGEGAEEALHLSPGRTLKDVYLVGKVLGYGGFGVTYLGWNTTLEQRVAIKEYLPNEFATRMPDQTQVTIFNGEKSEQFHDGMERFIEEANRLVQFRESEGIVRIYESFKENNTAYIIMEYLDGQTLTKYLEEKGLLPADEVIRLMSPIIQSLRIVHEHGIIHRDIAPDNIIASNDGQVKLIDFGAARFATTTRSRSLTVIIKPGYSPEEQYRSRGDQGPWTDVYAVGATMYRMITGQTPPDAMERRAFFEGKKKDILMPLTKYTKKINENQETAILNAMNVRIEDRTPDMGIFEQELTSEDEVKRRFGKIRKIDLLKWPLWTKIAVPAAACLVTVLSVLFMTGFIGFSANLQEDSSVPDGMAKVPSIVNNDIERAHERINGQLSLQIIGKEESNDIPANLIMSQDLVAGSIVAINSELKVIISAGAEVDNTIIDEQGRFALADVQYRTLEEALEILEGQQGMIVTVLEESSETVAAGVVISQSPIAGALLEAGTEIILIVSSGQADDVYVSSDDSTNATRTLRQIDVTAPNKTIYEMGESFNSSGMIVTATYSDNSTRVVSSASTISGFDSSSAGTKQITVSYTDDDITRTARFAVTINEKTLSHIEVTPPDKSIYEMGESFSSRGMEVVAVYSDNTSRNVTSSSTVSGFDASHAGLITMTVYYTDGDITRTASFVVTINAKILSHIDVTSPDKSIYEIGESFSSKGMEVIAIYSDNSTRNVTSSSMVSGFDSSQPGTSTIVISYSEDDVTVTSALFVTINSKALTRLDVTPPSKITYKVGENFDSSGMIATAIYSDKSTKNVTSSCTIGGFNSSSAGQLIITVSYTEGGTTITAQFTVAIEDNMIAIANVIGQSHGVAVSTLQNQGFLVTVHEEFSDSITLGNIISQNPSAGSLRDIGSHIAINVSKGVNPATCSHHPYTSLICAKCGGNSWIVMDAITYYVRNDRDKVAVYEYFEGSSAHNIPYRLSTNQAVTVVGRRGSESGMYRLSDGYWVTADNLTQTKP